MRAAHTWLAAVRSLLSHGMPLRDENPEPARKWVPQTGEQARRSDSRAGHRELEGGRGSAREPGRRAQRRNRSPQKRRPHDIEGLGEFRRLLDSCLPPRKGGRPAARATWPAFHIGEVLGEFGVRSALPRPHRLGGPDRIHQGRTRPPLTARTPPEPTQASTPRSRAARGGPALRPPPHSGRRAGVPSRTD